MLYKGSSGYEAGDACDIDEYAPHSSDCTKYYQCANYIFVEKNCAPNLHYNPDSLNCDYEDNVNCLFTIETGTTEQTTTETTPEPTTIEILTDQSTDETLAELTTEWLTVTTEK